MDDYVTQDVEMLAGIGRAVALGAPTQHLFHYTNADAALFGILATGKLRLSPLDRTNDLWESRPNYHPLAWGTGNEDTPVEVPNQICKLLDYHIRANAKVACLTNDYVMPESFPGPRDAFRGWSHLSLWAHYGAGHTGVCLRFDRDAVVEALHASAQGDAQVFHGSVNYTPLYPSNIGPVVIPQIREFGADAVAVALIKRQHRSIFFEKHQDWASESEYRLVRVDGSALPFHLDIRSALTGVILGESFPDSRLLALRELLSDYPDVELEQVSYLNRTMLVMPPDPARGERPPTRAFNASVTGGSENWAGPRRPGNLSERVEALMASEIKH
ncbi:DUF2971 domain-containing protein [Terrabacter sp. 2YAF2]|uniref:DUF2971 domain-containing protein n=1 Tax=Terrabacter sp. 2YAF2 TaxID=3233026 RepID=UPI003F9880E1